MLINRVIFNKWDLNLKLGTRPFIFVQHIIELQQLICLKV